MRLPSCVKLFQLLQWQSAHLAVTSAVRVFEGAVRAHAPTSRRATITMGWRGNVVEQFGRDVVVQGMNWRRVWWGSCGTLGCCS